MKLTNPIRGKKQVKALVNYWRGKKNERNAALIALGVHTALRVSDLLSLTWGDVYNFDANRIKPTFDVREKKTKKQKSVALHSNAVQALKRLWKTLPTEPAAAAPLFPSRKTGKPIGRVQAYRIICEAAEALNWEQKVSCHSLRKTFGYHSWKSGVSLAVIMDIYNHSSIAVTRRYLGVTQDDLNAAYTSLPL